MDETLNQLHNKTDQAIVMGIEIPKDGYWGNKTSKECGMVGGATGGNFTKNAVESFEKNLVEKKTTF
ncbi:alpha/beta-type small acid-soluble spore protein [Clostridium sp. BSD9I1]|uniref:alpha/beta-type small acid-soluble spore protein n=1 Tax=Clostridium sp. BSD9I1 TaxID=2003589 RepID=UPI0016460657|nr:alpha/beta-type small acid-soluble spore protein [Clostridium sp. BSD9I1]MBE6066731.1 alpha/beta-type small acid-soluble spore protein [Clostridium lundense]